MNKKSFVVLYIINYKTHGRTLQLLVQIGPVGQFGENNFQELHCSIKNLQFFLADSTQNGLQNV